VGWDIYGADLGKTELLLFPEKGQQSINAFHLPCAA
jgi:hypothetical protein